MPRLRSQVDHNINAIELRTNRIPIRQISNHRSRPTHIPNINPTNVVINSQHIGHQSANSPTNPRNQNLQTKLLKIPTGDTLHPPTKTPSSRPRPTPGPPSFGRELEGRVADLEPSD